MEELTSLESCRRETGRQLEAATLIARRLSRRIGSILDELKTPLKALASAQLAGLGKAPLGFTDRSKLGDWI